MNDLLSKLNRHPLNQTALKRLKQERISPVPQLMHLLTLMYDPEVEQPEEQETLLADYGQSPKHQQLALKRLNQSTNEEEIMDLPLPTLQSNLKNSLRNRPPKDYQ